jgi:hypothetical protein
VDNYVSLHYEHYILIDVWTKNTYSHWLKDLGRLNVQQSTLSTLEVEGNVARKGQTRIVTLTTPMQIRFALYHVISMSFCS